MSVNALLCFTELSPGKSDVEKQSEMKLLHLLKILENHNSLSYLTSSFYYLLIGPNTA